MTTLETMYSGVAGSPETILTVQYVAGTSATITVEDASVLPDAPNRIVIQRTDLGFVTVYYGTLTGNVLGVLTPEAGLITSTFGIGSTVARRFCEGDHAELRDNITILNEDKAELDHADRHTGDGDDPIDVATSTVDGLMSSEDKVILDGHVANVTTNPHSVTKTNVGLANVDNTSDANKPVSTAQATAIGLKVDIAQGIGNASKVVVTDAAGDVTTESKRVAPTAGFTWVEVDTTVSNTVNFTDTSTAGSSTITAWYWDFGDGTYSSTQSPSHTYSGFGIYQVSLRVVSAVGTGSITKSITVVSAPIYGYRIIDAESSPTAKVEYIEASVGFDPVTLNPSTGAIDYGDWETIVNATFTPSVLLANAAGYTDLDRTNLALYADGITPSPLDLVSGTVTDGDVCCRISHLIYEQITRDGSDELHKFCSKQPDASYVARAHRFGDEIRANAFLGMFEGLVISTVMYSRYSPTTSPTVSTTQDTYRSYTTLAKKGAATYGLKNMHIDDLHMNLSVLFLKTLNFQAAIGNGNSTSDVYLKSGEGLNLTGGPLQGDTTATNTGVMLFWVWNKYGNYYEDVDGFVKIEDGKYWVNRTNKDFLNIEALPTICPDNYDEVLLPTPASGYIRRMSADSRAPQVPIVTGSGADSTHQYCDYFSKDVGVRKLMRGGTRAYGASCGPFYSTMYFAPDSSYGSIVARLQGFLASE